MSLSFLLEECILEASLRFETFTITRLGPILLLIQWQFSTLEGFILTFSFSKIFKTVLSMVLLSLVSGIPVNRGTHMWSIDYCSSTDALNWSLFVLMPN